MGTKAPWTMAESNGIAMAPRDAPIFGCVCHVTQRRTLVFDRSQRLELALAPEPASTADAEPDAASPPTKRRPPRRNVPIITEPP